MNLFLLGDADLGLAAQDMPAPACLGQGRKGFQLKDKILFTQATQHLSDLPVWRNPSSVWATQETRAQRLEITESGDAGGGVSLGTSLHLACSDTKKLA